MDGQFAGGRSNIPHERVGIDELGIDTIGSVALAERTEGRIRDVLHGSEKQFIHLVIYHVPFIFSFSHLNRPCMVDAIY